MIWKIATLTLLALIGVRVVYNRYSKCPYCYNRFRNEKFKDEHGAHKAGCSYCGRVFALRRYLLW